MTMSLAKYIVIDGLDKRGKNTQSKMLASTLVANGKTVLLAEIPRKHTLTGKLIYWMLKNGSAKKMPFTFQALQTLNKLEFQNFELLDELFDYVILDRWTSSTTAYGLASGLSEKSVDRLNSVLLKPDLTIVITGTKLTRGEDDSFEADDEFQKSVGLQYDKLVKDREDYVSVSNVGHDGKIKSPEVIHYEIVDVLLKKNVLV